MDISSRFSLADFLAYLFPGIFTSIGVYFLLILTPLSSSLINLPTDLSTGILFLVFSYVVGVLISGLAEIIINRMMHGKDNSIPLSGFDQNIGGAFKDIFDIDDNIEWTRAHFYLCRSTVFEHMPNAIQGIQRQSGLRQLRMNMLPSIVIWLSAGIGWGWRIYAQGMEEWGLAVMIISAILGPLLFIVTINRMKNNDAREVRETLTAFLSGYKTGLISKQKQQIAKTLKRS